MAVAKKLNLTLIPLLAIGLWFVGSVLGRADSPASSAEGFAFTPPLGIPADVWAYYVPRDNPLTEAKVRLGRELFFDKRLSADGTVSCASCHDPRLAFSDGKKVAEGIGGKRGPRNSPTLLNAMFNSSQFWDGRAQSLEAQAMMPLTNAIEMGNASHDQVVARLREIPEYASGFKEAFGGPLTIDALGKAIASFERTLVAGNSPFDRFLAGDRNAMSEAAARGMALFRGRGRCTVCHSINPSFPFLSDQNYRNTGVAARFTGFDRLARRAMELSRGDASALIERLGGEEGGAQLGRFLITGNSLDIGAYRTPSLRNVELTAPYFHDGSAATLFDVVKFYVKGGIDNPAHDWELQPVGLSDEEQSDLVEFLKSLTSDDARQPRPIVTGQQ